MLTVIIHAGGKSERIREDYPDLLSKCWLEISGKPIIINTILHIFDYTDEFIIVVKDQKMKNLFLDQFQMFDEFTIFQSKLSIVVDEHSLYPDAQGPILSIKTGIHHARYDEILSLPSDLPFFSADLIEALYTNIHINGIVTIQSDHYFNSLVFMAYRKDLQNLSTLPWRRVTDVFRLFPIINVIEISSDTNKFFTGINKSEDFELAKELSNNYKNKFITDSNIQLKTMSRKIDLHENALLTNPQNYYEKLLKEKGYFLLLTLYSYNNLPPPKEKMNILDLECQLWKNFNDIIYKHCKKDFEEELN